MGESGDRRERKKRTHFPFFFFSPKRTALKFFVFFFFLFCWFSKSRRRRSEPIEKALGQKRGLEKEKRSRKRRVERQMLSFSSQRPLYYRGIHPFHTSTLRNGDEQKGYFFSFFFFSFFFVTISSGARTIDFHNVFGYVDKLVDETLAVHFSQDAALVIIPELFQWKRNNKVVG